MSTDDYVTVRQIGKGAFGTAHIVQHKVTGERFVLKRVRLARQTAKERQSSVRELLLLSNLRHRNVLEFKGCWVEGGCNLCMLVELCESGDLFTQLKLRHPSGMLFSEEHLHEMAVQLLSAVAYLHRSNIAHRDLKTANILVTGDGCLKLADFGLSTVLEEETHRLTKTMVGTPNYMSPCVLQEKPYGTPNDIWGLGCVLFELSSLKPAFQAFNMAGLVKKVTSCAPPPVPSCYSEHWRQLIRAMLTKEPDMRPSAQELLDLDWLQPAVRRVAARFGPELPPGAPDLLERLSDLPPDIMGLLGTFLAQEREEKRRADEARERRKAAAAKWDPLNRATAAAAAAAAAAAKQPKLPPLKPHVPRKPLPRPFRGCIAAAGPGVDGRGVPPLVAPAGGASPRDQGAAAGAERVCPRRKTCCGEVTPGRAGLTHLGGVGVAARNGRGSGGAVLAAAAAWGEMQRMVQPEGDGEDEDEEEGCERPGAASARVRSHRPSSAPPESPVRRSRRGDGTASAENGGDDDRRGDSGDPGFDPPLHQGSRRGSSYCGDASAWGPPLPLHAAVHSSSGGGAVPALNAVSGAARPRVDEQAPYGQSSVPGVGPDSDGRGHCNSSRSSRNGSRDGSVSSSRGNGSRGSVRGLSLGTAAMPRRANSETMRRAPPLVLGVPGTAGAEEKVGDAAAASSYGATGAATKPEAAVGKDPHAQPHNAGPKDGSCSSGVRNGPKRAAAGAAGPTSGAAMEAASRRVAAGAARTGSSMTAGGSDSRPSSAATARGRAATTTLAPSAARIVRAGSGHEAGRRQSGAGMGSEGGTGAGGAGLARPCSAVRPPYSGSSSRPSSARPTSARAPVSRPSSARPTSARQQQPQLQEKTAVPTGQAASAKPPGADASVAKGGVNRRKV